ncbi:MAG: hypothetical protein DSY91_03710 [Deltaproteobacteria bacterium]|nr:MAG: hypothetical protein DSY91_03710 [Deltaproteobacteria bacterium]
MTQPQEPYAGVIFDLEGTLVDFQWKIGEAVAKVKEEIREWGWTTPLLDLSDYAELYNEGIHHAPNKEEEKRFLNTVDTIYDEYDKDALTRWGPQPGAKKLLTALKAADIPIALCSNVGRKAMDGILLLMGWKRFFRITLSRDEVRFLKPEPEGLEKTISMLGLTPDKVIFIGDSRTDIRTAKKVGCHVAVAAQGENTRREMEPLGPDHLLASLEPLIEILKL